MRCGLPYVLPGVSLGSGLRCRNVLDVKRLRHRSRIMPAGLGSGPRRLLLSGPRIRHVRRHRTDIYG